MVAVWLSGEIPPFFLPSAGFCSQSGEILPIFLPSAGFFDHWGEILPIVLPSAGFFDHPGEIPPIFLPPGRSHRSAVPGRKGKQTVRPQMCLILRTGCCPSRSGMVAGPGIRFLRPGRTSFLLPGPESAFSGLDGRVSCCRARDQLFQARTDEFPAAGPKIRFPGPGNLYLESKSFGLRPAMSTAAAKVCH